VPESVAVNVRGRAHLVRDYVTVSDDPGAPPVEGVLVQQGSVLGGWSFHVLGGDRLVYVHNLSGWRVDRVEAPLPPLAPGDHVLALRVDPPRVALELDDEVVGEGEVRRWTWSRFSLTGAGLTAGWAPDLSSADQDYRGRFTFTHTLHRVDVHVDGDPLVDREQAAQAAQDALDAQ
jgi:hypothetical protein